MPAPHRPGEPIHKPSLRLKLDADADVYAGSEARVKVPKRRAPVLLGVLVVLGMLAGGVYLWLERHGGAQSFVAQVLRGTPPPATAPVAPTDPVPTAAAPPTTPPAQPESPPAQNTEPVQQPSAATPPTAAPSGSEPAAQTPEAPSAQVATGETDTSPEQPPQAAAPVAPPKKPVVRKPVRRREPVVRIQPIDDSALMDAPPPAPGGEAPLPPPDPPAPE